MVQLSQWSTIIDPARPRVHVLQLESSPHSLQLEKALMQQRRLNAAKKK